jgi:(2Fe-2S) ferredoxin
MGFLRELTREVREKSWLPKGSSILEKLGPPSHPRTIEADLRCAKQSFCDPNSDKPCVTVCSPSAQCGCGCVEVREALSTTLDRLQLQVRVGDAKVGCVGKCRSGPLLGFPQKGFFYLGVQPQDIPDIVYETILHGRLMFRFLSLNPDRVYRPDLYYERDTGFLAAIDSSICMVEVAKYFLDLEKGVSCGKCVPCRLGLQRMYESIDRIVVGQGSLEDLEQLRALCLSMITLPHCEFAMTSTRPALSALTYFEDEFLAHIERHQCPAGVCKDLVAMQRKEERRRRPKR